MPNRIFHWLYYPFALMVILFTAVMAAMILHYFPVGSNVLFLTTKPTILFQQPLYMGAFYTHIVSSILSLSMGVFQFASFLFHQYKKLHRWMGLAYILSIVLLAAPSGFIISMHANGGLPSQLGFYCLSLFWWLSTYRAYRLAKKKDYRGHLLWMIRSYAFTLAAFSLRTEGYLLHYLPKSNPIAVYTTLSWLSWVGNLFIVEVLLYLGLHKHLMKSFFPSSKQDLV